ncbi:MAG: type II toxin-antitoxin system VapC family toxin [Proteobacteria bacterium]|nr:type II toxin-antitoxin system VapC family toxin [Pseudomonadota bacterium]MBU4298302.1 type II toxin-antitoxin system VapC family toxin [Pseudomonadota bacterium]MCG2749688.1 type II toxin-antitoxin system VapC family toxin [Desulfobulbaceae bacterium]
MYLFDTDIITNIFKKSPSPFLLDRLAETAKNAQHISTITISEIVYGAWKSGKPQHHLRNLEEVLLPAVNIVGFDSKAAYICGSLRARLEREGLPLGLADLEIAAIAIANDLTLISGNLRHFQRIHELKVENWLI